MKGITLPEVLITIAIAVVVGGLLINIMFQNTGLFYQQTSRVNQGVGINDSLSKIRASIKEARSVAAQYVDGSTTYTSSASQLVLSLPSVDSSGNVLANTYDYVVYYLDQDKLRFLLFPNVLSKRMLANQIISSSAESLLFQYFDSSGNQVSATSAVLVKVTLTLRQKAAYGFETNIATSEANLRND